MEIKSIILVLVSLLFFLVSKNVKAQVNNTENFISNLRFYYNNRPDSVWIDSEFVSIEKDKSIKIYRPLVRIRAVKHCYSPIEQTISAKAHIIKIVRLKFKHLTTPERDTFRGLNKLDYTSTGVNILGAMFSGKSRTSMLSITGLGLVEQLIWKNKLKKYLDLCTGSYTEPNFKPGFVAFHLGGSSFIPGEVKMEETKIEQNEYRLYSVPVQLKNHVHKEIKINSSTRFDFELIKRLGQKFSALVGVQYSPFMNIEYQFMDSLEYQVRIVNENSQKLTKNLIQLNFNLSYYLSHKMYQDIYLILGGYWMKPIEIEWENPLSLPPIIPAGEAYFPTIAKIKLGGSGAYGGLGFNYRVGNLISFYMKYRVYSPLEYKLNGKLKKIVFFTLSAGIALIL